VQGLASDLLDLNVQRLTGVVDPRSNPGDSTASPWVSRDGKTNMLVASGRIDYLSDENYASHTAARAQGEQSALDLGIVNKLENVDLEHDLKFDMFQDPEVAAIVRQLIVAKRTCIQREDFRGAKDLKRMIEGLLLAGVELAKLLVIMQRAVAAENYDSAEMVRHQIQLFRQRAYSVFGVSAELVSAARSLTPREYRSDDHGAKASSAKRPDGGGGGSGGDGGTIPWLTAAPRSDRRSPAAVPRTPPLPEIGSVTNYSPHSSSYLSRRSPSIKLESAIDAVTTANSQSPPTSPSRSRIAFDDKPVGGTSVQSSRRSKEQAHRPLVSPNSRFSDDGSSVAARSTSHQNSAHSRSPPRLPSNTVVYTVEVITATEKRAGTDATITVQLFGEHGESDAVSLVTSKTNKVRRSPSLSLSLSRSFTSSSPPPTPRGSRFPSLFHELLRHATLLRATQLTLQLAFFDA
jgi:hypothetical protein